MPAFLSSSCTWSRDFWCPCFRSEFSLFSLCGWALQWLQFTGRSTVTVTTPSSHMAGAELWHSLCKSWRWFQPWCFPPAKSPVQHWLCWADPIFSSHLHTNELNANYLWLAWLSVLQCLGSGKKRINGIIAISFLSVSPTPVCCGFFVCFKLLLNFSKITFVHLISLPMLSFPNVVCHFIHCFIYFEAFSFWTKGQLALHFCKCRINKNAYVSH